MKFEKSDGQKIFGDQVVSVKKMNHIVEVKYVLNDTTGGLLSIRKLNNESYLVLDTGEVKDYVKTENRGQNVAGLKDTFRKVRDLINTNFVGGHNELHLTLTYAENMTDTNRLYNDFKSFWKRYKYKYGNNIDYLTVIEPQGRGAWHFHLLLRHNDGQKVFIPSDELAELWGHGFIKVKTLNGVDNIGAYLSAYLGDVEVTDENITEFNNSNASWSSVQVKEVDIDGVKKKFIKGGRLHMYPPGMNLYRHSKGIKFPVVEHVEYLEIKKIVGSRNPNYSRTIKIIDDEAGRLLNSVTYEHYNMLDKKNEE